MIACKFKQMGPCGVPHAGKLTCSCFGVLGQGTAKVCSQLVVAAFVPLSGASVHHN